MTKELNMDRTQYEVDLAYTTAVLQDPTHPKHVEYTTMKDDYDRMVLPGGPADGAPFAIDAEGLIYGVPVEGTLE